MPDKETVARAKRDAREGKSPGTQAGEFVREEMDHIREGKHGARSTKQAIAIGLSKARRAGVDLPAPAAGKASPETRRGAQRDRRKGQSAAAKPPSATRSRAATKALKREGSAAASPAALSRQAKSAAAKRTAAERSKSARQAARTKGPAERSAAARKAARTRAKES
ncbi:MAG TPA: DUF6496 domain-containing protein [Thermoanaerobaculia bacterium]|jgi:hypothetical protein|nr:DUF6496 domain-containing protein [Thermoanaerobaculia bacterium]